MSYLKNTGDVPGFTLHIQSMLNFNSVFPTIFSTPTFSSPTLQMRQYPFFAFNNSTIMDRGHKHSYTNNKKSSRAGTVTSPSPKLVYAVYKRDVDVNCAFVFMPNCTHMNMFSPMVLRLCDGQPPADFDARLRVNMYRNPTLDSMFYQFVVHKWVAGKQDKNNFDGTQSNDLYYLVKISPSQPTAPVLLSTLDAHTNLRVFDSLSDYATSEREPLPIRRVVYLRECTPPYHMVNIFDKDDRIPFQKISEL